MDIVETIFKSIGNIVLVILKIAFFLLLSIFVVPSMIVMAFLHAPWENMLKSVFTIDHF